jgi:hypothetical protein
MMTKMLGLLVLISLASTGPVREPDNMKGMVDRHNYWRARVGVGPLAWSDELASYAQAWANELARRGCKMEHRPDKGKWAQQYGENIYWSSGMKNEPADVVNSWASELKDYDEEKLQCRGPWYVCGHYTQVVWANTKEVGCGMARCGNAEIWVCNYNPPGNWVGEKPYVRKN